MDPLDLERLEYATQHEGTWQTLQAASGQRDLVVKLHGGLLAVITVAGPALASSYGSERLGRLLFGYLAVGALVLAGVSHSFLRGVQSLRMLQFEMYSASRWSRRLLGGGDQAQTYFSNLIDRPAVVPLARQMDPMGLIVQNVRHYLIADAFLAPAAGFAAFAPGRGGLAVAVLLTAAAVAGGSSVLVARWRVDQHIRRLEEETSARVVARYRELGLDL